MSCNDLDPNIGRVGRMDYWLVLEPRNPLVLIVVRRNSTMTCSETESTDDVTHPRTGCR